MIDGCRYSHRPFFACRTGRYRFAVFGGVNRALFSLKATEFAILPLTRSNKRSACAASQSLDLLGVILSQTGLLLIIQLKNTLPQPTSKKIKKTEPLSTSCEEKRLKLNLLEKASCFADKKPAFYVFCIPTALSVGQGPSFFMPFHPSKIFRYMATYSPADLFQLKSHFIPFATAFCQAFSSP